MVSGRVGRPSPGDTEAFMRSKRPPIRLSPTRSIFPTSTEGQKVKYHDPNLVEMEDQQWRRKVPAYARH